MKRIEATTGLTLTGDAASLARPLARISHDWNRTRLFLLA